MARLVMINPSATEEIGSLALRNQADLDIAVAAACSAFQAWSVSAPAVRVVLAASAEVKWFNGWPAAVNFEGDFFNVTRSYTGKGEVRHLW